MDKLKYGDKAYFVDLNDSEVECYIIEYSDATDQYKLLLHDLSSPLSYVFKESFKLKKIDPDYWDNVDEYIEKYK